MDIEDASPAVEILIQKSWNGTNWTEVNDNEQHILRSRMGSELELIHTAGIEFGWNSRTWTGSATESWNGTNWTEVNDLNTARASLGWTDNGTSTAALGFGGINRSLQQKNSNRKMEWN
jgi:hypothetical protein